MSYEGYRLIINGTTIYNSMIARGTYQFTKTKRMVSTWNEYSEGHFVAPTESIGFELLENIR